MDTAKFDVFISYSRRDRAFVDRLYRTLGSYAPPKGLRPQPGRLRVFCDTQDIEGEEYFKAIETHLQSASKLVVVCSPDAAASRWVDDEIERFVRYHGASHVIPLLWRGLPNNEARADQADQRAFPPALERALTMPLAADFRGLDAKRDRVDGESYRSAWTLLLSNVLDVSRAEVEQRELKRRRAVRRAWTIGLGTVFAALSALTLWALLEGERALARQLTAQASIRGGMESSQVERRVLLAREAVLRHERLGENSLAADTALRDALAHAQRRRLSLPPFASRQIAFSSDGEHLLAAEGKALIVYSLSTGSEVHRLALERSLSRLSASADARFVAAIDEAGVLRLWSWPDFTAIRETPAEVASAPLQCLTFSESGATIVALRIDAADARTLQLLRWRPGTAKLSHSASVRLPRPVQAAAGDDRCLFSRDPGGSVFNAVGGLVDTIAFRWPLDRAGMEGFAGVGLTNSPIDYWTDVVDLALDGNTQAVLLDEQGGVRRQPDFDRKPVPPARGSGVSILAPNAAWGARLVPLEDPVVPLLKSTRIDIVDTSDGTVARSLADHTGAAAFTPDGESIATVSGQRIRLWDRRDGRERLRMQTTSVVAHLAFDASSRQLAASGSDGSLEVFAIGAADEVARIADGQRVTVIDAPVRHVVVSGKRLLWPAAAGGLPSVFPLDGYVQRLTASPDGRFLVVGVTAEQPIVMFGDPPGMTLLLITAAGGDHEVRYSGTWGEHRFDHAATRLIVQGRDGKVRLIDTSEGRVLWNREVEPMREPPAAPLTGWHAPLAIADDGSVSAVSTSEGLAVLDNDSGEVLLSEKNWNGALALSSDGALLAHSQSEGGIAVVRVRDGSRVAQFDAREAGGVRDLMFSPGGALLMSIGGTSFSTFMSGGHFSEEHVIAWSLADGARVARIPESAQALSDYQEQLGPRGDDAQQLTGVVWNTSAREFAGTMFPSLLAYWTVPSDMVRSTLAAWRLEDTGIVEIYRAGAEDSATTGAFAAADGMLIHGDDGVQRVVDLRRSSVVAAACRSIPRSLTNEERRAALGGGLRSPLRCPD